MKKHCPVTMNMAVGIGVLILCTGIVTPALAQQMQQTKDHLERQEQQVKDEQARQWQDKISQERQQRQDKDEIQRQQQDKQRDVWQQDRAMSWQNEHRTWKQRGGYKGVHITRYYFRDHFGRNHRFRIDGLPFIVFGSHPRFQYSGYWFSLVDPWPENWSDDWYKNDDVYIDYFIDGYYLYNRRHPGYGIAINVIVN